MSRPQHDTVEQVYRWRRIGAPIATIARVLGVPASTVHRWLANPDWHPEIDYTAINNAVAGDWGAYQALTIWERERFLDELDDDLLRYAVIRAQHPLAIGWAGRQWDTVVRHLRRRRQQR